MSHLNLEAISYKYNNKLFPKLVEIFKDFHNTVNINYPDQKDIEDNFKAVINFASNYLNEKVVSCIKSYTGIELKYFFIYPSVDVNAFSASDRFVYTAALDLDASRLNKNSMIATSSDIAVNHIENFISNKYYVKTIAKNARYMVIGLSAGALLFDRLYPKAAKDWKVEYTVANLLHEIGHSFYVLDTSQQSAGLTAILDETSKLIVKKQLSGYDELIDSLEALERSFIAMKNIYKNPRYVRSGPNVFEPIPESQIDQTLSSLHRSIDAYKKIQNDNTPFDLENATYVLTLYANLSNTYWKNILFVYWATNILIFDRLRNPNNIKKEEQFADEFAVKNGAGAYFFKARVLDTLVADNYNVSISNMGNPESIAELSGFAKLCHRFGKYLNISNFYQNCGLYDNPITRLERIVKQSYPLLKDPNLPNAMKKDIAEDIKEARAYLDQIANTSSFIFSKGLFKALNFLGNLISTGNTPFQNAMLRNYSDLQNFTFDLIKNELPYQGYRLKQLI